MRVQDAVDCCDMEQALEHRLQEVWFVSQEITDLCRVSLEARGVFLGEIIKTAHVFFLAGRNPKEALKGFRLNPRRYAVRFRHLGGERRDGNCKCYGQVHRGLPGATIKTEARP